MAERPAAKMETKTVYVTVSKETHDKLVDGKGDRTWKEVLADGCGVEL